MVVTPARPAPRDGLGAHAPGKIATRDLSSTKCAGWPPLADARLRTGIAPREGVRPGLCARPAAAGDKGGAHPLRGAKHQARGGGGRARGGRSRAAPNTPLHISDGENTAREFSVFDK